MIENESLRNLSLRVEEETLSQERECFRLIAEGKISGDGSEGSTNNHQGLNFLAL